jgi:hypothetical protein
MQRGYSSFLGRAAGNQPHFQIVLSHMCRYCCSFLAFCFGASFTREEVVVYYFPKIHKLSLLFSPFVLKRKKKEL